MSITRILINKSDSGFGMSKEAHEMYLKMNNKRYYTHLANFKKLFLKVPPIEYNTALLQARGAEQVRQVSINCVHNLSEIDRSSPVLWEIADILGMDGLNDRFSKLEFVELNDDVKWKIITIGGVECVSVSYFNENKVRDAEISKSG